MPREQIIISTDFTDAPGARFRVDGDKSGEEFYEELLEPKFLKAKEIGGKLFIDLDNTWGYASSFISGSFGLLSARHGAEQALKHLKFKSDDEPLLIKKINDEIEHPNKICTT